MPEDFPQERAAYAAQRDRLLREHLGEYCVFFGDALLGTAPTLFTAWALGVEKTGNRDLFVRHIVVDEPVLVLPGLVQVG
jgi:hypothetical protein